MTATLYSAVITTLNNADTLELCLHSLSGADEIVVLDSGSQDGTREMAKAFGARVAEQAFLGYGAQKQAAVNQARHDWVLLLDADEALSPELAVELAELMARGPSCMAYRVRRREQLFWLWQRTGTKLIDAVRLFHRSHGHLSDEAVHAAVVVKGEIGCLQGDLLHYGEVDLHHKVARINAYSSGMTPSRLKRRTACLRLRMVFYPSVAFLREYLLRRQFVNGWAGYIAARTSAFYAFLKYAKIYDAQRSRPSGLLDKRDVHYREPGERG